MKSHHADVATLLRSVTSDLSTSETAVVHRHAAGCPDCAESLDFTRHLDEVLRSKRDDLPAALLADAALPSADPFAVRPRPRRVLAKELGLDAKRLSREVVKATEAATGKRDRLLKAAKVGGPILEQTLAALRLDSLSDRLALSYLLEGAREIGGELPEAARLLALVALNHLQPKGGDLRKVENEAAEHVVPFGDLLGLAHLLEGVGWMRRGDYDKARGCFVEAWRSFGEGRGAEHRLAAVEVYESKCRSFLGDPRGGLLLAERCLRTFAAYGMRRDAARAEAVRAIALFELGRLPESLRSFRGALAAFEKMRMWEEHALALGNAGACLGALGRRNEIARLYRERKPASKKAEPFWAPHVLRTTVLRSRGWGKKANNAGISALPEHLFIAANEPAAAIVAAAKTSVEEAEKAIRSLDGDPRRPFALLYAAQKGCPVVAAEPVRMLELSEVVFEEANSLLNAKLDARTPVSRELVQAEASILESYSHLQLGHNKEARKVSEKARILFQEGGDVGLGRAFCDFYGGQAAFFTRDFATGERLLKRALKTFAEFGQEHLVAWAQAALGTLLVTRGDFLRALQYLDHAVEVLDEEREPTMKTMVSFNRGAALARLERYDEARAAYARALTLGRKYELKSHLHFVRNGLAELDFRRGQYQRALNSFSVLANDALVAGYDVDVVFARLYIAECLGRLGFVEQMADEITSLRQDKKAHPFAASPAMEELFTCLDQGAIDADLVGHVRRYLEDTENGIQRPYRRLRLVG